MTTLTDINLDHQIDPQTPFRLLVGRSKVWSPDEAPEAPTVTWETEDGTEDGRYGITSTRRFSATGSMPPYGITL